MTRRFGDLWVGRHSFPGRPRVRSRKPGSFHLSMAGCGGGLTPELPSVGYELELDAPQPQTPGSTTPESVYDPQSAGESLLEKQEESPPEWPERLCSVCNLGETSPMGQGRLVRFEPTLGFQPFRRAARLHRSGSLDQDRSPGATLRRGRAHSPRLQRGKSLSRSSLDTKMSPSAAEDSLGVGFAEEPEVGVLFEPSGHTYVHRNCAAWSEGVCPGEDDSLIHVDKAVFSGMTQVRAEHSCRANILFVTLVDVCKW
ncbi:hypothetical protein ISCGN_003116 [Ixodes scapularis]